MPPKATQATTSEPTHQGPAWVVVRLRGPIDVRRDIEDTLKMLRLHHTNHAVIVPATATFRGMLHKVEHFVTYGEVDAATAAKLLKERGRLIGDAPITDEHVAEHTDLDSIEALAEALANADVKLADVPDVKPVFRLNSPWGGLGHSGKKRHFSEGGALGYRGAEINELIERMI